MHLGDLAAAAGATLVSGDGALDVTAVCADSRRAGPGVLFCALRGVTSDGHDRIGEAVAAGAVAVLVDAGHRLAHGGGGADIGVAILTAADTRAACGRAASAAVGRPSERIPVVGLTGTNGKTTTAFLLAAALEAALGGTCGLLGTVEARVGGHQWGGPVTHTTPDQVTLQAALADMVAAGDRAAAIEVSSHALDQRRTAGTRFAAAGFLNLTHEHLDYHGDLESYFAAKAGLFVARDGQPAPPAVVCVDDAWGRRLHARLMAADAAPVVAVSAGLVPADLVARDVTADRDGVRFVLQTASDGACRDVTLRLRGRFNVANALVAAGCALAAGADLDRVVAGLGALAGVPGRFEPVDRGQSFAVVVDYAHKPDALDRALVTARELAAPGAAVAVVVGAGGDRDTAKRPLMGAAAARRADRVWITSDNPRSEDPAAIAAAVAAGARDAGTGARIVVELDRRRAIRAAVAAAGPGDVVVIAGKGHERGQTFADRTVDFDDRDEATAALAEHAWTTA